MATSDTVAAGDKSTLAPRPSKKVRISNVLAVTELALRLSETYEFEKSESTVVMSSADPVLPHTWASPAFVEGARRPADALEVPILNGGPTIRCRPGVNVILGKSGSGKTRFALKHLLVSSRAAGHDSAYFKAFEPGDEVELARIAPDTQPADFEGTLAFQLAAALKNAGTRLIIIDSLRYLFYSSSGGATGKGGVNMGLFMDLTHLDILAARLGVSVFVVINPMTDDDAAFNFYVEAAVGAVTGVYVMDNFVAIRYTDRDSSSRDFRSIKLPKFTSVDGIMRSRGDAVVEVKGGEAKPSNVGSAIFGRRVKP